MISLIIVNYNTYKLTCECIKSIIEKTIGINYEIILVDNASDECEPERFKENFPAITLIKSSINLGFAKGCNLGILNSKGTYILLINSDVKLLNNAILYCYKKLISDITIGCVTCNIVLQNGNMQYNCEAFPNFWKIIFQKLRINHLFPLKYKSKIFLGHNADYSNDIITEWAHGTFLLFEKNKILKDTKLNENYFMYVEDMKWCWDINKLGYKIVYHHKGKILHYWNGSKNTHNICYYNNNLMHFIFNHYTKLHYLLLRFLML